MTDPAAGGDDDDGEGYTRKQIIKEEIEAPFRKIRFFLYFSLIGAASIGTVITLTMLLAGRSADMNQLYTNLAINVGGLPVLGLLYKRDLDSQNALLERIKKGGSLAGLRLKINQGGETAVVKVRAPLVTPPRSRLE
jgi:hypothetical protein